MACASHPFPRDTLTPTFSTPTTSPNVALHTPLLQYPNYPYTQALSVLTLKSGVVKRDVTTRMLHLKSIQFDSLPPEGKRTRTGMHVWHGRGAGLTSMAWDA